MGIITKFKSFFKDNNNNQYYWFDDEIEYLTNNGFKLKGSENIGIFIKGDTKIEKKSYFQYGEQYYYLLTNSDIEKRFESFSELKKNL
jgi:hypothetical protein